MELLIGAAIFILGYILGSVQDREIENQHIEATEYWFNMYEKARKDALIARFHRDQAKAELKKALEDKNKFDTDIDIFN